MAIQIDRHIPAPDQAKHFKDLGIARAMRALQPGESIYLEGRTVLYASRIMHRARQRRPGALFTSRTVEGGVRVWCLSDPTAIADMLK